MNKTKDKMTKLTSKEIKLLIMSMIYNVTQ